MENDIKGDSGVSGGVVMEDLLLNSDSSIGDKKYNVLLVSDYFYPNLGGVEMHMF